MELKSTHNNQIEHKQIQSCSVEDQQLDPIQKLDKNKVIQQKVVRKLEIWKNSEEFRFLAFMIWFKNYFTNYPVDKIGRKKTSGCRRFDLMSQFVKTKNAKQCTQKYNHLLNKYKVYDDIIALLKQKVIIKTSQVTTIYEEIKQFKRLACLKDSQAQGKTLQNSNSDNLQTSNLIIKNPKIDLHELFFKGKDNISFNYISLNVMVVVHLILSPKITNTQNSQTIEAHQQIDMQPNTLSKGQKLEISWRNTSNNLISNNMELQPEQEQQNQIKNFQAFTDVVKNDSQIKAKTNTQCLKSRSTYRSQYRQQKSLNKSLKNQTLPQEQKRTFWFWTLYQKYMFTMYWAMQKNQQNFDKLFNSQDFYQNMALFIGTKRTGYQCERRTQKCLQKYERNRNKFVQQEMNKYKISPQLAQQQRLIEVQKKHHYFSIGDFGFEMTGFQIHKQIDSSTYDQIVKERKVNQMAIDYKFKFDQIDLAPISKSVKSIPIKFLPQELLKEKNKEKAINQDKSEEKIFFEEEQNEEEQNVAQVTFKKQIKDSLFKELKKSLLHQDQTKNQGIYAERINNLSEISLKFEIMQSIKLIKEK